MATRIFLLSFALSGCGGESETQPEASPWRFSHTISGIACGLLYTTAPERVQLRGATCSASMSECAISSEKQAVDVYALDGAGDGLPFGVASLVELEACE